MQRWIAEVLPKLNHSDFCPGFDVPGDLPAEVLCASRSRCSVRHSKHQVGQQEATRGLALKPRAAKRALVIGDWGLESV